MVERQMRFVELERRASRRVRQARVGRLARRRGAVALRESSSKEGRHVVGGAAPCCSLERLDARRPGAVGLGNGRRNVAARRARRAGERVDLCQQLVLGSAPHARDAYRGLEAVDGGGDGGRRSALPLLPLPRRRRRRHRRCRRRGVIRTAATRAKAAGRTAAAEAAEDCRPRRRAHRRPRRGLDRGPAHRSPDRRARARSRARSRRRRAAKGLFRRPLLRALLRHLPARVLVASVAERTHHRVRTE
mmetsp:Transcript_21039/g.72553  ORF Transcript_21039/g.72553 Transcript_21039/m.72553 type:complete len:247 (+) Transcript_21039:616-1356(+)